MDVSNGALVFAGKYKRFLIVLLVFSLVGCTKGVDEKLLFFTKQKRYLKVIKLLGEGADVNAKDELGSTALIIAADDGNELLFGILLRSGADVNAANRYAWTALMLAAKKNHFEIVKKLLDHGAKPDFKNVDGWTALMWASAEGYKNIVELLLDSGANINEKDSKGQNAFSHAEANGNPNIAELLLSRGSEVVEGGNVIGSALVSEAKKGLVIVPDDLPPKLRNKRFSKKVLLQQAFIVYVADGNIGKIKACLDMRVGVNFRDEQGFTPLMHAVKNGRTAAVHLLVERNANVNAKTPDGISVLSLAESSYRYGLIKEDYRSYLESVGAK